MIERNLNRIRSSIREIALRCGRNPDDIRLVAVSKRFPVEAVREAHDAGQIIFGENYLQEAVVKRKAMHDAIQLHFIGNLQSNKAKLCADTCDVIETVDRLKIAAALSRYCQQRARALSILVQVNIGLDDNKSGVLPDQAETLLTAIKEMKQLRLMGLMTMPPYTDDPEDARPYFRDLRLLAETMKEKGLLGNHGTVELSMGMSHDYHIAIEEGATLIRIGTAIFGQRPSANTP
jgi:pyridoxal phosphate enzyme (YggS family)